MRNGRWKVAARGKAAAPVDEDADCSGNAALHVAARSIRTCAARNHDADLPGFDSRSANETRLIWPIFQ